MATKSNRMDGFSKRNKSNQNLLFIGIYLQMGDKVASKDERNEPPIGWKWEDEWTIDTNRAVDEQGH